MTDSGDALDDALDAALRSWLDRQAVAEERLTAFAFHEGQPDIVVPPSTSRTELRAWILRSLSDPAVESALRTLGDPGRAMADLVDAGALDCRPGDRVAVAARIGVLAAGGLVARDLEADRVGLTELGRAALAVHLATGAAAGPMGVGGRA
ncbi:MAG: hypothetical protein OEV61_03260 [Chloroflexota bacterium]|jgi:hypothetical protein|nr:hypothetical protein [Chloroflexota bacterium]MDH5243518.1 hypothetical protein [Chloroflexota bacterium]